MAMAPLLQVQAPEHAPRRPLRRPWRRLLLLLVVELVQLGSIHAMTMAVPMAKAADDNDAAAAAAAPHCQTFRDHCAFNATTASCVFTQSTTFRCGPVTTTVATPPPTAAANASWTSANATTTPTPAPSPTRIEVAVVDADYGCQWELSGDLLIADGVRVAIAGDDCLVHLSLGQMLVLGPGARLEAASVAIDAAFVRLERDARLRASFNGTFRGRELRNGAGDAERGASSAGSGGWRRRPRSATQGDDDGDDDDWRGVFGAWADARQLAGAPDATGDRHDDHDIDDGIKRTAEAWALDTLWARAEADPMDHEAVGLLLGRAARNATTTTAESNVNAGGGRIRITASRDLVLMPGAKITANGADATEVLSAGAGGSVLLSATALSLTEDGGIEARGGAAMCVPKAHDLEGCRPAGGGGRVQITYTSSQLREDAIVVVGGALGAQDPGRKVLEAVDGGAPRELMGGTGTFLRILRGADGNFERTLVLSNFNGDASITTSTSTTSGDRGGRGAVTPLGIGSGDDLDNVVIRDGAVVAATELVLGNADLSIRNGSTLVDGSAFLSKATTPRRLRVQVKNLRLTEHSAVLVPEATLEVTCTAAATLDASSVLHFARAATIVTHHDLNIEATVQSRPPRVATTTTTTTTTTTMMTTPDATAATPEVGAERLALESGDDLVLTGPIAVGSIQATARGLLHVNTNAASTAATATTSSGVNGINGLVAKDQPGANAQFHPCELPPSTTLPSTATPTTTSSNYTIALRAGRSLAIGTPTALSNQSTTTTSTSTVTWLRGSGILLCAGETLTIAPGAVISSSGLGERANQGPGSGACVGSVGGGGGYGGRGADASAVNELGDYATGGLAYGTRAGFGLLGSGGGCVDGGAGGGVVMLGASRLRLDGTLACDGLGGVNGAGGGSGGFLGLTIATSLTGHGSISAVGGGATCLDVPLTTTTATTKPKPTSSSSNATTTTTNLAATLLQQQSTPLTRVCGGGGGGGRLQLHGCEHRDKGQCTSGFAGDYTVAGGATTTSTTTTTPTPSTAKPNNASPPPAATDQALTPAAAARGSFFGFPCRPGAGGLFCRPCRVGTFKSESNSDECAPCTNAPGNAHYIGTGTTHAACDWACDPGYTGAHCVSPLQQLLDACGGEMGFTLVLFSIVLFFILLGYACRNRKEPSYHFHARGVGGVGGGGGGIDGVDGRGGRGRGAGALGLTRDSTSTGERRHLLSSAVIASTQRSRWAFLVRWLYWPRVGYPKLQERDLPEHMARIYLSGVNDREAPLRLRLTVPASLGDVLYDDEFRLLAERINEALAWPTGACTSGGDVLYGLVALGCFPLASIVAAYRRHRRINALKRIIGRYNHACMKGPRARGLLNALKLGYAGDYSLVYLELLYKESAQSTCIPTTPIGKPTLPIVLLFAGRGTFASPYFLDPSDLLVRSIPQCPELTAFIDEPWIEFVAELNELLRVVSRDEVALVETLLPVARFLERKMNPPMSQGPAGKLGGLRMYLGRFYVGDDMDCGEEFKLGLLLTTAGQESRPTTTATTTMTTTTTTPAPPSLRYGSYAQSGSYARNLDTLDPYAYAYGTGTGTGGGGGSTGGYGGYGGYGSSGGGTHRPGRTKNGSFGHAADSLYPYDLSSHPTSTTTATATGRGHHRRQNSNGGGIPKTFVSSIREEALRIRSNTSGSVENLFAAGSRIVEEGLFGGASGGDPKGGGNARPHMRRRRTFYEGWLGPVDASLPVPGVLISAEELEDRLVDRPPKQRALAFVKRHALPANVPRSRWLEAAWMLNIALLALLMVDLAITFAIAVNLQCVIDGEVDAECTASILMPVLLLPPMTLFLSPIMGIVSLAIASPSFSRRYAIWNALSMGNVGITILICLLNTRRLVAPWFTGPVPLLPVIAMVIKAGEAAVIERYISYQETHRRRRGWRGLMKRRLSDASIPPESPYASPVSGDTVDMDNYSASRSTLTYGAG